MSVKKHVLSRILQWQESKECAYFISLEGSKSILMLPKSQTHLIH